MLAGKLIPSTCSKYMGLRRTKKPLRVVAERNKLVWDSNRLLGRIDLDPWQQEDLLSEPQNQTNLP